MNQLKKIALFATLAALVGVSASASAATTNGTITLNGSAVVSCTVNSPTVNLGPVATGVQKIAPVTLDVNCPTGTTWTISSTGFVPITVGADSTSNAALLQTTGGVALSTAGLTGVGTGAVQATNLQVMIDKVGLGGLVGTGVISGTVPFTITY